MCASYFHLSPCAQQVVTGPGLILAAENMLGTETRPSQDKQMTVQISIPQNLGKNNLCAGERRGACVTSQDGR
jgi:hypothetical protein